jgi:hypothetical protein
MRQLASDTLALLVFSTLGAGFVELVLVGLTLEQTLLTRAMAVPVIIGTGWPYGLYRDGLMHLVKARTRTARLITDTLAFLTFQMPVYAAILAWNGASAAQIVMAVGAAVVVVTLSGGPYGLFLDSVRRLFGVLPAAHPR